MTDTPKDPMEAAANIIYGEGKWRNSEAERMRWALSANYRVLADNLPPAMVEAAAKAPWDREPFKGPNFPGWDKQDEAIREGYREFAKAALRAAFLSLTEKE